MPSSKRKDSYAGGTPAKKSRTLRTAAEKLAKDTLTGDASTWQGMPLTSVEQITPEGLKLVMDYADRCKKLVEDGPGSCELLKGKIMASVFYEASTRTNCSFQAAMLRCTSNSLSHICNTSSDGL